jgi:hypothetical protein
LETGRRYAAFWSYTRFDDEHDGAWLSDLREALVKAVRALSGKQIEIFQDVDGIAWGERWKRKLVKSAEDAVFLIPIITPNYFESEACRDELAQFVVREKTTGSQDLILPVYYITAPHLEDRFKKASDYLAQAIGEHNYEDTRDLRHRSLTSYDARQKIDALATSLIGRLNGFARAQLSSTNMRAAITAPPNRAGVPQHALILGTVDRISDLADIWVVVETGTLWHPQPQLPRGATTFQTIVLIGRAGLDGGQEFPVHIVAVTEDVTNSLERYLKDAARLKNWPGIPNPTESRVLATIRVVRDDAASIFSFLEGVYDEYRADGKTSGGTVALQMTGADIVSTEARNSAGLLEWTGKIKLTASGDEVAGRGTYSYKGRSDSGQHEIIFDRSTRGLNVVGKNTSQPNGEGFDAVWKRRA